MSARRRSTRTLPTLVSDSALMLTTTTAMAIAGSVFWLIAARVAPTEAVGVAASLISGVVVLSLLSQLGLNVTLVRVLPVSTRPRTDIGWAVGGTATLGFTLGVLYALLVPMISHELEVVRGSLWHVLAFGALVAGTAANVTADAAFLSLRKLKISLLVNGGLMSVLKCGLPLVLASVGPFGLLSSVGLASSMAALTSVALLMLSVGRPTPAADHQRRRPSPELINSFRFAGAGYVASLIDLVPLLLLPLIVISTLGSATAGIYLLAFQIVSLLNAGVFAVGGSMYAAGARDPHLITPTLRRSAVLMGGAITAGALLLILLAPHLLTIFGSAYSEEGTAPLRVLALGSLALAAQYWAVVFHRLHRNLKAMVAIPTATTVAIITLAIAWAPHGPASVAAAWGTGYVIGAIVGLGLALRHATQSPPPRRVRRDGGRHRRTKEDPLQFHPSVRKVTFKV